MKLEDLRSLIAVVPLDCVLFNDIAAYYDAYGAVSSY